MLAENFESDSRVKVFPHRLLLFQYANKFGDSWHETVEKQQKEKVCRPQEY